MWVMDLSCLLLKLYAPDAELQTRYEMAPAHRFVKLLLTDSQSPPWAKLLVVRHDI